jgi:hypothetical protein
MMRVEWITCDVHHRRRHQTAAPVADKFIKSHPAECSLVYEAQFASTIGKSDADPEMFFIWCIWRLYEKLPTHPKMADNGAVTTVEHEPEILTATTH